MSTTFGSVAVRSTPGRTGTGKARTGKIGRCTIRRRRSRTLNTRLRDGPAERFGSVMENDTNVSRTVDEFAGSADVHEAHGRWNTARVASEGLGTRSRVLTATLPTATPDVRTVYNYEITHFAFAGSRTTVLPRQVDFNDGWRGWGRDGIGGGGISVVVVVGMGGDTV